MTTRTKARVTNTTLMLVIGATVALLASRSPLLRRMDLEFDADHDREAAEAGGGEAEMPRALGEHMERLSRTIPGNGGELREGPGAADDAHFEALAYPDADIPLARLDEARQAFFRVVGKGHGRGRRGDWWQSVGPSQALYPFTDFRNSFSYVPNEYYAGGRATALAIDPECGRRGRGDDDEDDDGDDPGRGFGARGSGHGRCRLWMFAAGGGVWRTDDALSARPKWRFVSASFGMNSGSALALDPNDADGDTIYAGTGEANASGDSAAGVGLYRSTNGGNTWEGPLGRAVFAGRAIASIAVTPGAPNTIYVATTRGVAGVSSVSGGTVSLIPGAAAWGLYKSTDGGATWTFLHNGAPQAAQCDTVAEAIAGGSPCSLRGVRRIALDPSSPTTIYASSYNRGIWRSVDAGLTWTQIYVSLSPNDASAAMRAEFAVTTLAGGTTRMYVYEGGTGTPVSRLFRTDDATAAAPAFTLLTSSNPASPGYGTYNLCTGQCSYDNFVYSPAGYPDVVYIGGAYSYGEQFSNKRAVVLSTDAGVTATDMTMDATDPLHPNGLHPDQHALVTHPGNPFLFFEVNDGGLMRSSGEFADVSAWCADRGVAGAQLARCQQLLSRVPTRLTGMNRGVQTLQFQSLSVSPFNPRLLQGGTQDNGTWQSTARPALWRNTMIGDGGQSGFDVAEPAFRFHTFFQATPDINLAHGDIAAWNWIGDQIFGTEPQAFYVPIITDPKVSRTMFVGTGHVWRTKTWGMGTADPATHMARCNEWTGTFDDFCGDWEPLGATSYVAPPFPNLAAPSSYSATRLTASGALYGTDRAGGTVAAVERAPSNTSTLWAATSTGRVFISRNVDAEPASAVTFTRLDGLAANDPNRFVTGIHIDPADANHAWISYSGFSATTPTTPGHVFEVRYTPAAGTATWTDVSFDLGDIPITDVVRDDRKGDLYASSDFGVYRLLAGDSVWTLAAPGMPAVEVSGLTIHAATRRLYAATHGLGAWLLPLPR